MNLNLYRTNRLRISTLSMAGIFLIFLLFQGWSAQGQNLETYIEEAFKNNPIIQVAEKQFAISTEKISEVNTLPNTDFSGGYMVAGNKMNMMQQSQFTVMQMFPWFGTIPARTDFASATANADKVEIDIAKRKIALALTRSWYRLYEINAKQQVLDSNIQLLKVYEKMALTSVQVGKASAVSVLRLQMRQNDLLEKKLVLQQDYAGELTTFNKIMNRDESANVAIVDNLSIPEKDVRIDITNLDLHPQLTKFGELNRVVALSEALNKKESAPNLGIGMEYMQFNGNPNMLMPMVSVSIPIFNKKYTSISRQNRLRHEELDIQKQSVRNSLITELQSAIRSRNAARISLETQVKNVTQAQNANEMLLKNYENGIIDFREVLDIQELQLEFQMKSVEAVGAYYQQTSIINYFIGRD